MSLPLYIEKKVFLIYIKLKYAIHVIFLYCNHNLKSHIPLA
jgi:hypothetical protein